MGLLTPFVIAVSDVLVSASMEGNADRAMKALKAIASAQTRHKQRTQRFGSLAELRGELLITQELGSGRVSGYDFVCAPGTDDATVWTATATPTTPESSGTRFFGINHTGEMVCSENEPVVFADDGSVATESVHTVWTTRRPESSR